MHDAWEGGERPGVAWRRLLAVAALVAVVGLSWAALRSQQGLSIQTDRNPVAGPSGEPEIVLQPPVRAGTGWVCGAEHPVRAFASGWFYPPEHPVVPDDTAKPEGCYLSADWAQAGGYDLAPTPPDAEHVASLYLVPATAPSIDACQKLADTVGFAVPCPRRLPAPGRASSCLNSCLFYGDTDLPGVVIEQRGFQRPLEWCDACEGDVVITAVRDRSPPELISCGPAMAAAAQAGEAIAGFHDCPPGPEWLAGIAGYPHERHTMLVWEDQEITYAISMEGHSAEIRALLGTLRGDIGYVETS